MERMAESFETASVFSACHSKAYTMAMTQKTYILLAKVLGTGFGAGYSPVAPGTAGSLLACLLLWWLHQIWPSHFSGNWQQAHWLLLLIVLFLLAGVWAANKLQTTWGKDPSRIVIDEIAGMLISMLAVPVNITNLAISVVLFRIFDIWKPLGIRKIDQMNGGWGVMLDDVAAGGVAAVLMHLWLFFSNR